MSNVMTAGKWILRFVLLYILSILAFVVGAMAISGAMPIHATSEPGMVSPSAGLLLIALANLFTIASLILTSRWSGWRLAISLAFAFYGAVTLVIQVESWYFLSSITLSPQLLRGLFLMGLPMSFVVVPLAVWILGKAHADPQSAPRLASGIPIRQVVWTISALVIVYLILYFGAGYFIAWQNPELRAFYGQPGEATPFITSMINTARRDPMVFPLQILRALLWVACALPVILGSRLNVWLTALVVGLFFSLPQNINLIVENPLMPIASVRMSHLWETASSTFVFGAIIVWLLLRKRPVLGSSTGSGTDGRMTA